MMRVAILLVFTTILLSGCDGCSKSARKQNRSDRTTSSSTRNNESRVSGKRTTVKMEKINGVFQIPVEINEIKMFFIFDTGASMISISETEANFLLKQG